MESAEIKIGHKEGVSDSTETLPESKNRVLTVRNLLEASRGIVVKKAPKKAAKVKDMLLANSKGTREESPEAGKQKEQKDISGVHDEKDILDGGDSRRYNLRQRKKSATAYVEKNESTDDSEDDMTLAKIRKTNEDLPSPHPKVLSVAPAPVSTPVPVQTSPATSLPMQVLTAMPTSQQTYILPTGQVMSPVVPSNVMLAQPIQVLPNQSTNNIYVLPQQGPRAHNFLPQGAVVMQPFTQGMGYQVVTDNQGNKLLVQNAVIPQQAVPQVAGPGTQLVQSLTRAPGPTGQVLQLVQDVQGPRLLVPGMTPGIQLPPAVRPPTSTYLVASGMGVVPQHQQASTLQPPPTGAKEVATVTSTQGHAEQKVEKDGEQKYIVIEPDSSYQDDQNKAVVTLEQKSNVNKSGGTITVSVSGDDHSPPTLECYMCRVCGCLQQDIKNIEKHLLKQHLIFNSCKTCNKSFRNEVLLMEHCLQVGHIRVDRVSKFVQQREVNKNLLVILIPLGRDKDGALDIPVFYCLICGMVHVHQPFIRSHITKEHGSHFLSAAERAAEPSSYNQFDFTPLGKGIRCYRRFLKSNMRRASLTSISDLTLLCNQSGQNMTKSKSLLHRLKKSTQCAIDVGPEAVYHSQVSSTLQQDSTTSNSGVGLQLARIKSDTGVGLQLGSITSNSELDQQLGSTTSNWRVNKKLGSTTSNSRVDLLVQRVQEKAKMKHLLNESNASPSASQSGASRVEILILHKCKRCGFSSEKQKEVSQHVLQTHCHQFEYVYKCVYCDYGCFEFPTFTTHVKIEHAGKPMDMVINSQILGHLNTYVNSCINSEYSTVSPENEPHTSDYDSMPIGAIPSAVDESCDVTTTSEIKEEHSGKVASDGEILRISDTSLLDGADDTMDGGKEEGLLTYDPNTFVPDSSIDIFFYKDTDDLTLGESENTTGEAYACKLCAYSCETEERIKKHLQSVHIAEHMYPFNCPCCIYRAPTALRIAQHVIHKHRAGKKPSPIRLAKAMMADPEEAKKIMKDEILYQRFLQELDCLYRNCVEKSMV